MGGAITKRGNSEGMRGWGSTEGKANRQGCVPKLATVLVIAQSLERPLGLLHLRTVCAGEWWQIFESFQWYKQTAMAHVATAGLGEGCIYQQPFAIGQNLHPNSPPFWAVKAGLSTVPEENWTHINGILHSMQGHPGSGNKSGPSWLAVLHAAEPAQTSVCADIKWLHGPTHKDWNKAFGKRQRL